MNFENNFWSIFKNTFGISISSSIRLGFGKSDSAKFIRIRLQKSFVSKLWRRGAFNLDCIRDGKEGGPDNLEIRVGNCARINSGNVLSTWQQTKLSVSNNPWEKKSYIYLEYNYIHTLGKKSKVRGQGELLPVKQLNELGSVQDLSLKFFQKLYGWFSIVDNTTLLEPISNLQMVDLFHWHKRRLLSIK